MQASPEHLGRSVRGCAIGDAASQPDRDWVAWHRAYEDPSSALSRRLEIVRSELADALDALPAGRVSLLCVCAGDGRDVLGVLASHRRATDVTACLVELDPRLAAAARDSAAAARLDRVRVEVGDAGLAIWYEAARPVDVLLCCGVFGNIDTADLARTIDALALVVAPGGFVIWTRHRRAPDQTPTIRGWFEAAGFEEHASLAVQGSLASVGVARRGVGSRRDHPLPPRLFRFMGDGASAHC